MDTINAAHVFHATLQRLRQSATLPLAQLCKQVQTENYQDWRRWESRLDYRTTMRARYGLDIDHTGLLFDADVVTSTRPDPQTETLPLFAYVPTHTPEVCPMDLLKLSISKDALIPRDVLHGLLTTDEIALLPTSRNDADNVRKAMRYRLRPWQRFEHGGKTCKAEATETKGHGLDVWLYVKEVDNNSVGYTGDKVCQITDKDGAVRVISPPTKYRALVDAVGPADNLLDFGKAHYFESDVRELCNALLEAVCVRFWSGVLLALTDEAHNVALAIQGILRRLDAGAGSALLLSLDNTPANREALARELAEGFSADLDKLTAKCNHTAPMVETIQAQYDALSAKIALAESVLGVEIDCLESQVSVELALSAAQAA